MHTLFGTDRTSVLHVYSLFLRLLYDQSIIPVQSNSCNKFTAEKLLHIKQILRIHH